MSAPKSLELVEEVMTKGITEESLASDGKAIVEWLGRSWEMVDATLAAYNIDDLESSFEHEYFGNVYAVSRQWTIWRIMAHDIHHGGQLSMMLYAQGIEIPELGDLGGHLTMPPIVRPA
jgi:uncharacterized damage-inducible protein DinB